VPYGLILEFPVKASSIEIKTTVQLLFHRLMQVPTVENFIKISLTVLDIRGDSSKEHISQNYFEILNIPGRNMALLLTVYLPT
jgi:hypothetical protein